MIVKTNHYNQDGYRLSSGTNEVYVSELGGHVMPYFFVDGKLITPYGVAPWYDEDPVDDLMIYALRGNFFGFPFGEDTEKADGERAALPCHGNCACKKWEFDAESSTDDKIVMKYKDPVLGGSIQKELFFSDSAAVMYERDWLSGFSGKYPFGFHPCVQISREKGKTHVAMSKPVYGSSMPVFVESTENDGYILFELDQEIPDYRKVKSIYGDWVDLSHQPVQKGIEDVVLFANDKNKKICFSAITNLEEGYVYLQLKNPEKLSCTMMWISNGGRHYAPWNGRVHSWLGLEELTSYFYLGTKNSTCQNALSQKGIKTYREFKPDEKYSVEMVVAMMPIPEGFTGVQDVVVSDDQKGVKVLGLNNEELYLPVDLSFLE